MFRKTLNYLLGKLITYLDQMIRKHLMNNWDLRGRRSGIILTLLSTYDLLMGSKLSVSGLFILTAPHHLLKALRHID